ncbi:MAG: glycosyltransferase family 2 protein, partial [Lachnospiraceae bacterium]|nr:glycosyltransferase family 2 protein [Lachnospiraceae bacterium]
SDEEHGQVGEYCLKKSKDNSRIKYQKLLKNTGISGNTNECYKMSKGRFIGLLDHDDLLHPSVLYEYVKAINEQNADYLYCDECTFHGNSVDHMITLHFKPDFSPDNLRANNYICHFSVFDRELLKGEELFRSRFDGSQDHDMILRLTSHAKHIVHVPKLMYYWRSHKGSTAKDIESKSYAIEAARGAIADHLDRCGFQNYEILPTKAFETIFRIRYQVIGNPKISILIPNKDHPKDIRRCVSSIVEKSSYDNYEILILENNTINEETLAYYESLKGNDRIKIIDCKKEDFNYSAINNFGASQATGDYLLLLNNDTEVISLNWMEELLMYAQREDVGAVGAKLYYPDKTIQHAGIVIGLGAHRSAGHTHYKVASTNLGYMGRLCYAQNVSAVTGACLMVKKSLWDKLGGLDESFRISLNDVDFCMRLRRQGYLNVWNPYCELYHYESASRGSDASGEKAARYEEESARFREKYADELAAGDPYYNVNFSLNRSDYTLAAGPQDR